MKKKRKVIGKDSEDEEEEKESDEEGEEEEEGEEDEENSEDEDSEKQTKNKSKKYKNQKEKKIKQKKDKKLNKSVVEKNRKKLNTTTGKLKQNRSVVLKKKNLLDKIKNKNRKLIEPIKKVNRSQSVTNTKKSKIQTKMIRTNRSAIVKGQKNSFYKNKTKNNNNFKKYNRTTRSEQKFYKGKNKIESDKKRSKTPMATRYSKFSGNRKLKSNKFSKTHMNNRSILNRKNKNFSTQRTFNNTSNGRLMTVESNSLNKRYFNSGFPQFKRRSDELGPVITKRKFMQNTQNFFPQRQLHLLKRDSDSFADREREKGFFNRITLYPKNIEQDETHSLKGDTLNPYSTNWPSNFLKIGYSSGFYYDDYQDGVPILRLKRLRNKIILPPIQNTRYSNIFQKTGEIPSLNFKYMQRQERINYILNTENNDENNVFKSQNAR